MMFSVKAFYQDGEIKLLEKPNNIKQAQVIVTFLEDTEQPMQTTYDFSALIGQLQWQGNAVSEQRRLRDEW